MERAKIVALENAPLPPGMYYGYEPYTYSMRSYGALTLLGGCTHRSGENRQGGRYEQLRSAARVLFPESREAWLISLADKLCAISEFCCFRIALARRHKVVISYG